MSATLAELARLVRGTVRGNGDTTISGAASLERAGPTDIAFVADAAYMEHLATTRAGAVVLSDDRAADFRGNALISDNPQLAFAQICAHLSADAETSGVHPSAVVDPAARVSPRAFVGALAVVGAGATIADRAWIGAGCLVGRDAAIGEGTRLNAGAVIQDRCVLGRDCVVQSGAVIGGDGFGFVRDGERWIKQPQLGRVVIGDQVEVGANSTIDRGTLDDTSIGTGVKIDNLVHIAHNVRIGEHTAIAACVGVAGSTVIGKRCTIAGQVGIIDHLTIVDDVHVTADSLVTNSITRAGTYSSSLKAEPVAQWRRTAARLRNLDAIAQRLRKIEEKLNRLIKE